MQVSWDCVGCSSGPPSCSPVFTDILPLAEYQGSKRHISTPGTETQQEKLLIDGLIPFGVQTSQGRDNTTTDNAEDNLEDDNSDGVVISDAILDYEESMVDTGNDNLEEYEGKEGIEEENLQISGDFEENINISEDHILNLETFENVMDNHVSGSENISISNTFENHYNIKNESNTEVFQSINHNDAEKGTVHGIENMKTNVLNYMPSLKWLFVVINK